MNTEVARPYCYLSPFQVRTRIARDQPLGLPLINMAFNELPYVPSANVAAAMSVACANANRYGDPTCKALRQRISQLHNINAEDIICGNGSEELLDVIARNFVQAGDEIVMSEYGYVLFELIAKRLNAQLTKAPESEFTANVDSLLASISAKTSVVFIANPNNPTGTVLPVSEIERLLKHLPSQILLVLDLAYGEFTGSDYCAQIHSLVASHNNLVVTRTFSKAFGLAGVRVGWCHAPNWMIPGFYMARGMGTVNAIAQAAANAALNEVELVDQRVTEIVAERERVMRALRGMDVFVLPSETNFLLISIKDADAAATEKLVDHIFDTAGILVTLAREGGLDKFMRFNVSLPEHNDQLLQCINSF